MTNQYFNQQQYNQASRQTLDQILKKTMIYSFEGIKYLAAFIKSMWQMVLGK
jgi:hypothetical protein